MTIAATPETVVKVEPYASFVQVGEIFTINVTLTDVQNLYGVDVSLRWDASILQVVGVDERLGVEDCSDGVLHENVIIHWSKINNTNGRYWLAASSTKPALPFSGSGTIVRITFNVTNLGGCKLDVEATLASAEIPSMPIPHTTFDGFFGRSISISISPTTISIGENVSVGGFVIPGRANVTVVIEYFREGEAGWHLVANVTTNEQGNYLYVWRLQEEGKFEIRATAIVEGLEVMNSSVLVVNKPRQPAWLYAAIVLVVIIAVVIVAITKRRKEIKKSQYKWFSKSFC